MDIEDEEEADNDGKAAESEQADEEDETPNRPEIAAGGAEIEDVVDIEDEDNEGDKGEAAISKDIEEGEELNDDDVREAELGDDELEYEDTFLPSRHKESKLPEISVARQLGSIRKVSSSSTDDADTPVVLSTQSTSFLTSASPSSQTNVRKLDEVDRYTNTLPALHWSSSNL